MKQTAHAQPSPQSNRRIDDVRPAPAPAGEKPDASPAQPAAVTEAPVKAVRPAVSKPYGAVIVALAVCVLLLALTWYAYRH